MLHMAAKLYVHTALLHVSSTSLNPSTPCRSRQGLLQSGWGDDEADIGPLNPNYDPEFYSRYSDATRRNLSRLDEDVLDLDLVEEVVRYIDVSCEEGAILVFMPGRWMRERLPEWQATCYVHQSLVSLIVLCIQCFVQRKGIDDEWLWALQRAQVVTFLAGLGWGLNAGVAHQF